MSTPAKAKKSKMVIKKNLLKAGIVQGANTRVYA